VYLAPEGGSDAETEEPRDGDPGPGAAGSPLRDPLVARRHLNADNEAGDERSAPSSQGTWEVASRWSRSPAKGCCLEDGAEEGRARIPEAEDWSPPSQASARSWASSGIEEESGINPAW